MLYIILIEIIFTKLVFTRKNFNTSRLSRLSRLLFIIAYIVVGIFVFLHYASYLTVGALLGAEPYDTKIEFILGILCPYTSVLIELFIFCASPLLLILILFAASSLIAKYTSIPSADKTFYRDVPLVHRNLDTTPATSVDKTIDISNNNLSKVQSTDDIADADANTIRQYKALLDAGTITQDEFNNKFSELIDKNNK